MCWTVCMQLCCSWLTLQSYNGALFLGKVNWMFLFRPVSFCTRICFECMVQFIIIIIIIIILFLSIASQQKLPCRGIRVLYGSESLFAILAQGNQSIFVLWDHSQWLVLLGKTIGCLHKSCRICCYRNYRIDLAYPPPRWYNYSFIPRLVPPYRRELGISYIHSILIMAMVWNRSSYIIPEIACLLGCNWVVHEFNSSYLVYYNRFTCSL